VTLIISNADVEKVLTMKDTIAALENSYRKLAVEEAVCRPRIDVQIPTKDPNKVYQWGTMEGGSIDGYFAIRMKSDVVYEQQYNGVVTQEKYCTRPGLYCGLILLIAIENGEPVAILNDGILQHMRVGADGGIGVKYMAREDSHVVGILGSGGMARSHMAAFTEVRDIKKIQVYSPTPANREAFAEEMRALYSVEVTVCDTPRDIYKGADIVAGLTDSAVPVLNGEWLEKGTQCWRGRPPRRRHLEAHRRLLPLRQRAGAVGHSRDGARRRVRDLRRPPGLQRELQAQESRQARAPGSAARAHGLVQGRPRRQQSRAHGARSDHLFGARQSPGRAVLCRRRRRLRESEGEGPRLCAADGAFVAGYSGLIRGARRLGENAHRFGNAYGASGADWMPPPLRGAVPNDPLPPPSELLPFAAGATVIWISEPPSVVPLICTEATRFWRV
jgi:ornithine cyclodeaminase/alanine dehydrogenase-like protein (mu-crystallin family)